MVDLINLVGTDTNEHDNWAQENLDVVTSVTASPFHPVAHRYNLTNPYELEQLFYFRPRASPTYFRITSTPACGGSRHPWAVIGLMTRRAVSR